MGGIIDFHSHILPGMDDGSSSAAESLEMLRMEAQQGIRHVVATPHFYPQYDTPERFLRRRAEAEAILRKEMQQHTGLPGLSVGAEVYYFPGIGNSEAVSGLTIGGKKGILIEMPASPWSGAMYRELEDLHRKQGLLPIVAHVDRYIGRFRTHGIPERLLDVPVLVQANAEFFLRRSTASMALRMLQENKIHLLGSDCHNLTSRKPNLGQAIGLIEKRLGTDMIAQIINAEQSVLYGEQSDIIHTHV